MLIILLNKYSQIENTIFSRHIQSKVFFPQLFYFESINNLLKCFYLKKKVNVKNEKDKLSP